MHYQPATSRQLATQLMRPPGAAVRVLGRHERACVPAQESTVPSSSIDACPPNGGNVNFNIHL